MKIVLDIHVLKKTAKKAKSRLCFWGKLTFFAQARANFKLHPHQIAKKSRFFKNFSKISQILRTISTFSEKLFPVAFFS
jgi:hypothetical protein